MKKYIKQVVIVIIIILIIVGYVVFNKKENVNNVYPSVVHLECKNEKTTSIGSGIVYNTKNGNHYIVTSYHIIKGYSVINVYDENLDKEQATILNYDENSDIALLLVDEKLAVKKASFNINKKVKKNEEVYILTSSMGSNNSYIIKAGKILKEDYDIKINNISLKSIVVHLNVEKGDSGSPLIDTKGKVIGMLFLKDKKVVDKGYVLPINFIFEKIDKLERKKNNLNLGALMTSSNNETLINNNDLKIPERKGVIILSVKKDYPLYEAGLRKGDLIVKFNNSEIKDTKDLKNEVEKLELNSTITVEFYRNDKIVKSTIKLNK